jgi:hypothetical protein
MWTLTCAALAEFGMEESKPHRIDPLAEQAMHEEQEWSAF